MRADLAEKICEVKRSKQMCRVHNNRCKVLIFFSNLGYFVCLRRVLLQLSDHLHVRVKFEVHDTAFEIYLRTVFVFCSPLICDLTQ
jgi:hypothetical protein